MTAGCDPFRERALRHLDVSSSVSNEQGVLTIRMSADQFDHMIEAIGKLRELPDWWDEAKTQIEDVESALADISGQVSAAEDVLRDMTKWVESAEREAKANRRVAS